MEQQSLITVQEDLAARSKKALIRGILAAAIPMGIIFIGYFIFVILTLAIGIGAGMFESSDKMPLFFFIMFLGFFFVVILAGVVMMTLAKSAWNQVRAIRRDAINAGVRRPATSIVAHVFGISGFASGLTIVIVFSLYTIVFGLFLVIAGLIAL